MPQELGRSAAMADAMGMQLHKELEKKRSKAKKRRNKKDAPPLKPSDLPGWANVKIMGKGVLWLPAP